MKISKEVIYAIVSSLALGFFIISTFFITFNIYFYVFCLLFASFFIFQKPESGLYTIIICTVIFERFFTLLPLIFQENIYKLYPLDIIIMLTLLSYLIHFIRSRKNKFRISRTGVAILVFVIFCVVAFAYGLSGGGDFNDSFSTLKNYGIYAVMFFLTINIIRSREQIKRITYVFIGSGIGMFFFIFYGIFRGAGLWIEFTPLSTVGTRLLAPTHAFYLCVAVILILNFIAHRKKLFGNLTIPIVLIMLLGIVGSLTRHLWIALAIAIIVSFLLLSRSNKKSLIKIVAIQLFLVIMIVSLFVWFDYLSSGKFPAFISEFYETTIIRAQSLTLSLEDESAAFRLLAWQEAWETFIENPIIGIGFGKKLAFDYFGYPTKIEMRDLHNNFISIALQMGILGFISFGLIQALFVAKSIKIFKKFDDIKPIVLGYIACFILFLVSANFGVYFDINLFVISFWIFMGVVISAGCLVENKKIVKIK